MVTSGDESSFPSSSQCRHHYLGYCKTKENICPQGEHLELTCQLGPACTDLYCKQIRRHPRYCKFYISGGFCSHGRKCRYTHINFLNLIQELKAEVKDLKHAQKESLERMGKPKAKTQTTVQSSPGYPCTVCSKICLSTSGLKRHIQIKHAQEELLQNPVKSKPDESKEPKEETVDEQNKESQITAELDINVSQACSPSIPDSKYECVLDNPLNWRKTRTANKKQIALMVEEKLQSYYSKINEDSSEEEDINPRQKYIFDLRTKKKYIYDNQEPAIFTFTSNGDLSQTVFYNQFYDKIPSSELGMETMDSQNRIQFSNVKQVRSYDEDEGDQEADDCLPNDHLQGDLQGDQGGHLGSQDKLDEHHQEAHHHDHQDSDAQSQDSHQEGDHHDHHDDMITDISMSQDSDEDHQTDISMCQDIDDEDTKDNDEYNNDNLLKDIENYFSY